MADGIANAVVVHLNDGLITGSRFTVRRSLRYGTATRMKVTLEAVL